MEPSEWFGTNNWNRDSGAFPDFVLACESHNPFGNGALLELKDSKGKQIASFNSTLPSAKKRVSHLTKLVREAVSRYEERQNCSCADERDCFYLIRTMKNNPNDCRLSIVQGTFFETIPNSELIRSMFRDIFEQAGVPESLLEALEYLSQLDRSEIAQSRRISKASVKPRLRIMSEVISEANPHTYPEILARTANLVIKSPSEDMEIDDALEWVINIFNNDRVKFQKHDTEIFLSCEGYHIKFDIKLINHRKNGKHIVVQYSVPPSK